MTTSPLIIPGETMVGIQNVRKLFAEQLAEREYQNSEALKKMEGTIKVGEGTSLHSALSYAPLVKNRQTGEWDERSPLAPLALKALEPLTVGSATIGEEVKSEVRLRGNSKVLNAQANETGEAVGDSLVGNGVVVA